MISVNERCMVYKMKKMTSNTSKAHIKTARDLRLCYTAWSDSQISPFAHSLEHRLAKDETFMQNKSMLSKVKNTNQKIITRLIYIGRNIEYV